MPDAAGSPGPAVLRELSPMLGVAVLAVTTAGVLVSQPTRSAADDGLADFDHKSHLDRGLECGDCHVGVQEDEPRARAGVPSVAICAELCHGDFDEEARARLASTVNGRRILAGVDDGIEPWWPQVYWLPGHVVFSHRRHVAIAGFECSECHGAIAEETTLPREPAVEEVLTMDGCMECHEQHGASNDCFRCHR